MPYQTRPREFLAWAVRMFGPIALDRRERLARFMEEAIELAHAEDMPPSMIERIIGRVYSRPKGSTAKEIGQAQACLECFSESIGLCSALEAEIEWGRVQMIPPDEWKRRHAAKVDLGIASA